MIYLLYIILFSTFLLKGVFGMSGVNYINPSDRGRFGFSESGEYKAPYKGAHIVSALLIAAGISLDVIAFFVVVNVAKKITPTNGEMLVAMGEGLVMAIVIILTVLFVVLGVRLVSGGYTCKYTANDEKFVLTIGGDIHTIYYKDVQAVHFIPRMSMGAVRGYNVTVKINGANENFAIVFDGFLSEKNTPFYIIQERADKLHLSRDQERARMAGMNAVGDSSRPIRAEDIANARKNKKDVYDRMAELLGKDAEMPGVSLASDDRNTARAVRAYKAEQEARAADSPVIPEGIEEGGYDMEKIMEKVSPQVGGYAADMPSLGKDGKVIKSDETYIGFDGREVSIDDVQDRGTFHGLLPKKLMVFLWIVVALMTAWVLFGIFILAVTLISNPVGFVGAFFGLMGGTEFYTIVIPTVLSAVAAIVIMKYIRQGKEYSYRANGREFVVSAKNMPEEHIYYNEVAGVTYSKLKFLWFENGYNVEILTGYGITKYQYLYPRFRHAIKTEELPFEIIRQMVNRQKPTSK